MSELFTLNHGASKQFTTFNLDNRSKTVDIKAGDTVTVVDHQGCGVINRLWLTFPGWFWQHWNSDAQVDQTILRKLVIRIYWDNNDYPSVESPVGDFFGIGHCEYKHYTSKYLGMPSGGFYCKLPMPFATGVKIEIENTHETMGTCLFFNANYNEYNQLPLGSSYFHCQYLSGTNDGRTEMVTLDTVGTGHFVGCALSMQGVKGNQLYFLEAPEFIYIDGEQSPSIYGTGLEDYFNGGWYFRDGEFAADLYGAPLKDSLKAMVSMYRFHEEDKINFTKSFKMVFDNPITSLDLREYKYSSTSYYYLDKPSKLTTPLTDDLLDNIYRIRDVDHVSIP